MGAGQAVRRFVAAVAVILLLVTLVACQQTRDSQRSPLNTGSWDSASWDETTWQ